MKSRGQSLKEWPRHCHGKSARLVPGVLWHSLWKPVLLLPLLTGPWEGSPFPGPLAAGPSCSCFILVRLFLPAHGSTRDAPSPPTLSSGSKVTLPLIDHSERLSLFCSAKKQFLVYSANVYWGVAVHKALCQAVERSEWIRHGLSWA